MLTFHSSPGGSESWWGGQRRPQPQHPNLGKVLHSAWMYRSVYSEWQENIPKPPRGPLLNWEVPLSSLAIILTPYWMFLLLYALSSIAFAAVQSVQFSCSVVSDSLWPHGLQHARPPCPSPTPRVYSNPCPLSWWCHPAISSSVVRKWITKGILPIRLNHT